MIDWTKKKTKAQIIRETSNAVIIEQITKLEEQQTSRLLREASLGNAFAKTTLKSIDDKIAALRLKLI